MGGVDLEFVGLFLYGVVWCHIINCWPALGNDMTIYLEATPGSSDRTHFVMFLGLFHGLKGIQVRIIYIYIFVSDEQTGFEFIYGIILASQLTIVFFRHEPRNVIRYVRFCIFLAVSFYVVNLCVGQIVVFCSSPLTHRIHVWYIIFTYIYHKHQPNVGKYTIHGILWVKICRYF